MSRTNRIVASVLLVLVCVGAWIMLSESHSESSPDSELNSKHAASQTPKILTMAVSENIGPLNPQGYQGNAMFAQNSVYEGLLSVDKYGELTPSLALSWEISKDQKTYDFILREDVKFSNGEAFDAHAVVLNFQSILKNRARHSWSGLAQALERVEALSPYQVRLVLKAPYAPTLSELSAPRPYRFLAPSAFPADLDLIKHNPTPIGTGAYMLVDSKQGISDTLRKNPHFRGASGIYFDEIRLKVIFDPNAKLAALKSQQIDMIYGYDQIPLEIFKALQEEREIYNTSGAITTQLSTPLFTTSLIFNSASLKLRLSSDELSRSLRLALGGCVDKQALVSAVYGEIQGTANALFASVERAHASDSQSFSESASLQWLLNSLLSQNDQQILQNLSTEGLELLFMGDNPAHKMMAEIIQAQMRACGVNISLRASEPSIYKQRTLKGSFDLAFNDTWGAPYEPLSLLHSMLIPSHIDYSAQSGLAEKPLIDRSIRELMKGADSEKLSALLSLLEQSGVYMPLTYARNKAVYRSSIKGVNMGVAGYEVPFWEFYKSEGSESEHATKGRDSETAAHNAPSHNESQKIEEQSPKSEKRSENDQSPHL